MTIIDKILWIILIVGCVGTASLLTWVIYLMFWNAHPKRPVGPPRPRPQYKPRREYRGD